MKKRESVTGRASELAVGCVFMSGVIWTLLVNMSLWVGQVLIFLIKQTNGVL